MDLNKSITLSEEVIRLLYRNFGNTIDETNIVKVFDRWKAQIPGNALRLSLTIQQATGSGLTVYFTTVLSIKTHIGFPWAKVSKMLPIDWASFHSAVGTVGNNVYFGKSFKIIL